jgi:RNA polymerase sigma-54 factor
MAEGALELRQGQSLVMTQQLRQSIQMLQLSTSDLNELIDAEIEKNPLLKREEEGGEVTTSSEIDVRDYEEKNVAEVMAGASDSASQHDNASDRLDVEEGTLWGVESGRYENTRDGARSASQDASSMSEELEQRLSSAKSLHQEVLEQLGMKTLSPIEQKLVEYTVDLIDGAGYLPIDIADRWSLLGVPQRTLERVIGLIQECEPTGVGARSLRECLRLQLEEKGLMDSPMSILLDHLELVVEGKQKQLCRLCAVTPEKLSQMLALIKCCNPKPASGYDVIAPETLIPEVIVRKSTNGEWVVELNQDVLPKVLVDQEYILRLKRGVRDKADTKAISEHLANAAWLTKALHQRSVTLVKVATEIVRMQHDFFEYGIEFLKPMTLKDIAAEAECHESTVSRITNNKYLTSPRGIFELKYFFTSMLTNANGGGDYSSRSVMHLIKQIVDAEAGNAVLSDDEITEKLNAQGIDVARRTVVKYRQQMDIPSSIQRRRSKKMPFY